MQNTGSRVHRLQQLQLMGSVVAASRLQGTGSMVVCKDPVLHDMWDLAMSGTEPLTLALAGNSPPLSNQGRPFDLFLA